MRLRFTNDLEPSVMLPILPRLMLMLWLDEGLSIV